MKTALGIPLGLIAILAGAAVLVLWGSMSVAWVGAAALITAGIALVITSLSQRNKREALVR